MNDLECKDEVCDERSLDSDLVFQVGFSINKLGLPNVLTNRRAVGVDRSEAMRNRSRVLRKPKKLTEFCSFCLALSFHLASCWYTPL